MSPSGHQNKPEKIQMNGQFHNRTLRMLLPLALALLAIACSKTIETPEIPEEADVAIDFGGRIEDNDNGGDWETKTRALDPAGIPVGAQFGVFTYYTAASTWAAAHGSTVPRLMYNQMVEKTATGAVYSPERLWSPILTNKYTFFAYLPYSDGTANGTGITMNTLATAKGVPKINFTVQDNVADHVDLLVAQVTDRAPGDHSPVMFTFQHVTTRIRFAIAFSAGMDNYSVKVTGIRLKGVRNTSVLSLGGTSNTTPAWSSITGNASYTILDENNPADDYTLTYSATPTLVATPGCYLIPQNGTAGQPIEVEIDYAVTTHAGSEPYVKTTTVSFNAATNWAIGKSMLYTLTLQHTTITFTAQVEGWETTSVSGEEIVLTEEPMI